MAYIRNKPTQIPATTRREVTAALHKAARRYWAKKMYSVHHEVGILPDGQRKVDVFAFTMKHEIVICEVKSGAADFDSDKKYRQYLAYCHRFYFVVTEAYWNSSSADRLREAAVEVGAGVLVLPTGNRNLVSMLSSRGKRPSLPPGFLKSVITKLAWRLGHHRGNVR